MLAANAAPTVPSIDVSPSLSVAELVPPEVPVSAADRDSPPARASPPVPAVAAPPEAPAPAKELSDA